MVIIGALLTLRGITIEGPLALLPYWASAAFLLGGAAYWFNLPVIFGKQPNGGHSPLSLLVMLPYLLTMRLVWRLRRALSSEDPFNEVSPGIYVGRRPLGDELPGDVELVVDMTCEFAEGKRVLGGRGYMCLPTMDGSVPPDPEAFQQMIEKIVAFDGKIYIHCAYGHGRAAVVAAATLVGRGIAKDSNEALEIMKGKRQGIRPNKHQNRWLRRVTRAKGSGSAPEI